MLTIDEIKIEGEEDGFHLVIHTFDLDDGNDPKVTANTHRYRIGLPDQFHAETVRTIGRWLDEGEAARATMPDDDPTYSVLGDLDAMDALRDIERRK